LRHLPMSPHSTPQQVRQEGAAHYLCALHLCEGQAEGRAEMSSKADTKQEEVAFGQPPRRQGRKAGLLQTTEKGLPDCGRLLIYFPCMRCQCPLTHSFTDKRYRFLCIRCHEYLAKHSRRRKKPCRCAKIDQCVICLRREERWRWRNRNKHHIAQYSRAYTLKKRAENEVAG
jgi:hypothetical protein